LQYVLFLLQREVEQSHPYVKRWITELRKIKKAKIIILFGSVLTKKDDAGDIDVLLVTNNRDFNFLKKEIESINFLNEKKIHPLYQSENDFMNNIKNENKVVLNALKGVFIHGGDKFIKLLSK